MMQKVQQDSNLSPLVSQTQERREVITEDSKVAVCLKVEWSKLLDWLLKWSIQSTTVASNALDRSFDDDANTS